MDDSGGAGFWDDLWASGTTPWQLDGVPPDLVAWAETVAEPGRVLIPGCGAGHEVAYLADRGWDVTAIDFSAEAVAAAQALLGTRAGLVRRADFFALADAPFDVLYEHTFLTALPPRLRDGYAAQAARLVRPGGLLVGCFVVGPTEDGPPFATSADELATLLGGAFEPVVDRPATSTPPLFAGRERWLEWRRRG